MDRWMYWPVCAALGTAFTITLVCEIPGLLSFVMIPASQIGYGVAALIIMIAAGIFAARRHPRRAASLLLGLIAPVLLWTPINWAAECTHLALTIASGGLSVSNVENFEVSDWSVGFAGGPNTFLIHDKTDRIALPLTQDGGPSKEGGFREDCAGKVRRLVRHYYICTF